ncbi:MAG: hypothetical protein ACOY93_04980 [Bacillota bacterium]
MEYWELPPWEDEEEYDSEPEVDAVFRAQRRLSLIYGAIFLLVTLSIPALTAVSRFWTHVPVLGGFSLNFLVVGLFYHVLYVLIGAGYAMQANRLEQALLGRRRGRSEATGRERW